MPTYDWNQRPRLKTLTDLTIDADGNILGHFMPRSFDHGSIMRSYVGSFHRIPVTAPDGTRHRVGRLCDPAHSDHASLSMTLREAVKYYATKPSIGYVKVFRDRHGLGLFGHTHETPHEKLIGGLPTSGDWRRRAGGDMSLIGLVSYELEETWLGYEPGPDATERNR